MGEQSPGAEDVVEKIVEVGELHGVMVSAGSGVSRTNH
jgi:hypothetical protein